MVQLEVLSGKKAGTVQVARHFPVRIGRSADADVKLDDDGVWEDHLELALSPVEGFVLTAQDHAVTAVNGTPIERAVLRHGDVIVAGSCRLRFWLAPTRQRSLWWHQTAPWALLVVVTATQILLINWLSR